MSARPPADPIRILIADDSPTAREVLEHLLSAETGFRVVGQAEDGERAVALAARLRPDVVVMDIHMPGRDGYEAARGIMELCPTRIVMVSAVEDPKQVAATFRAVDAGALAVLAKPVSFIHPGYAVAADELVRTIRVMAEVKVVGRWPRRTDLRAERTEARQASSVGIRVVGIGASTGGPAALKELLSALRGALPAPLLIVQHISAGFTAGFVDWLAGATGYPVEVAVHGRRARPGVAYVAPDNLHMTAAPDLGIVLSDADEENGLRPSVSALFRSLAANFGADAVGVLLTGMGRDGARELRQMRDAGAVTIAQDRESSVVYGMPAEAMQLDAARYVLSPERIAGVLADLPYAGEVRRMGG